MKFLITREDRRLRSEAQTRKMSVSPDDNVSSAASDAMMELLAPDGYYKYLGITKRTVRKGEAQQQSFLAIRH